MKSWFLIRFSRKHIIATRFARASFAVCAKTPQAAARTLLAKLRRNSSAGVFRIDMIAPLSDAETAARTAILARRKSRKETLSDESRSIFSAIARGFRCAARKADEFVA